MYLLVMKMFYL